MTDQIQHPVPLPGEPHNWPAPKMEQPSDAELEEMVMDGVATTTDGCDGLEPDGWCEHGHPSWLIALGLM